MTLLRATSQYVVVVPLGSVLVQQKQMHSVISYLYIKTFKIPLQKHTYVVRCN